MKLRSLWIGEYRSLQDVAIQFPDPQALGVDVRLPPVHLLLGVNGTGKTAVLRALAEIFAALDDRRAPDIPFAFWNCCANPLVRIISNALRSA